ncbi:circularly permuted type 2 ATP-grasp protein [Blastococcus sp. Marseille-P5729]|uniref:circularly permuted type 2 ATP-grasp protein n=1 Tax=Blastococcus sp. Marseille-P5729 TaxID=2086582 RepID=UPI00131AAF5F|nr:circularly permuted type 2 ATP-grasp protein [Blastococcus sp. Marseille-P5729]
MSSLDDYLRRSRQYVLETEGTVGATPYDEVADRGAAREHWKPVFASFDKNGAPDLSRLAAQAARFLEDDGVTYNRIEATTDDDGKPTTVSRSEPWQLDVLPLVIGAEDWKAIEAGVEQRVRLLEAILVDLYGEQRLLASGQIPTRVVMEHGGYLRLAHGVRTPGPHQLALAAVDLGRGPDGHWQVIGDRTQAPSGAAYAMENRRVLSRLYPEVHHDVQIDRLLPFFNACRKACADAAPKIDVPQVVVLSPGANSETAFDQAYFASMLGYPLVEGSDLTMRDGRVWMRSAGRTDEVDVIVRRVDAAWTDPLFLRSGSRLGVPGLLDAARRQTVAVLNGFGSGVLENPGLMPFLPALCRELLGEELLLPSVQTWWCGDEKARSHVLAGLPRFVVRPIDRDKGPSVYAGNLDAAALDELRARVEADPSGWVGQEPLTLSHAPVYIDREVVPRPVILRTFAVSADDRYAVMRGGLARVMLGSDPSAAQTDAPDAAPAQPFYSRHGQSTNKDVWVLMDENADPASTGWLHDGPSYAPPDPFFASSPRILSDLFWIGRYSARAEDLLRLILSVREISADLAHTPRGETGEALQTLRQAMTQVSTTYPGFLDSPADVAAELRSLLTERDRLGTVAQSLQRLSGALQEVRDQFSADVWLALGGVERALAAVRDEGMTQQLGSMRQSLPPMRGRPLRNDQLVRSSETALVGMLSLSGIFYDNMITDPGWRLLDSGRAIERALHVVALLRSTICMRFTPYVDAMIIDGVLTATESIVTYRRRYRGRAHIEGVLRLLLLDTNNPRSVIFALDKLAISAEQLAQGDPGGEVKKAVGTARTLLEELDVVGCSRVDQTGQRAQLHEYLGELYDAVQAIGQRMHEVHLSQVGEQRAMSEGHYAAEGAV